MWKVSCFLNIRPTTEHDDVALTKEGCKLDMIKYEFSRRTINEWTVRGMC